MANGLVEIPEMPYWLLPSADRLPPFWLLMNG